MKRWHLAAVLILSMAAATRAADITPADLIKERLAIAKARADKDLEEIVMKGSAKQYVIFGMTDEGKKIAEKITDEFYKGEAFMMVGQELLKQGDLAGANEMLGKIGRSGQKAELARAIMLVMAKQNKLADAEAMAAKILDADGLEQFIAPLRAAGGDVDGAKRAIDAIKNPDRQDDVRKLVVESLTKRGDVDNAEKWAREIKADPIRCDSAAESASSFIARDKKKEGARMLEIAREAAKDRKWATLYFWSLGHLAKAEALAGNMEQARRIFADLPLRDMIREDAQWETVQELVKLNEEKNAAVIARSLEMTTRQVYFKFELVEMLAKAGRNGDAKTALEDARRFVKQSRMETEYLTEANTADAEAWVNGPTAAYEWAKKFKDAEMRSVAYGRILSMMQEQQEMKK